MKKPIDILLEVTEKYWLRGGGKDRHAKPGQAIESLKSEEREILKGLKSDDLKNLRMHISNQKFLKVNCGKHGPVYLLSYNETCPYCINEKQIQRQK